MSEAQCVNYYAYPNVRHTHVSSKHSFKLHDVSQED